ncbi:MAG: hypothetical protein MJ120_01070 [Clostridia bacterium]|nr:hypothetical protein [Clostridia bacterium]
METEKKAAQFMGAINKEAEAQYQKIKQETDEFVALEIEKAREAAKINAKAVAKAEVSKISERSNTDTYKNRTRLIMDIVSKRKETANKVFDKALEEIKNFTAGSDYAEFLKKSVQSIKDAIGDDAVIFIRPEDEKFKDALMSICGGVEFDKSIKLGGCKGASKKNSMRADDTLDSRFEQQKQEFYSYSGLSVN